MISKIIYLAEDEEKVDNFYGISTEERMIIKAMRGKMTENEPLES